MTTNHLIVLSALLAETSLLYEQERVDVDRQRWEALRAGIAALRSQSSSRPIWDCRVCGYGVREGAALDWNRNHGRHYDVHGAQAMNYPIAYCPTCNDETLREQKAQS